MGNKKKRRIGHGTDLSLAVAAEGGHKNYISLANKSLTKAAGLAEAGANKSHYWPTEGWRTSAPEAQGMDAAAIADALEEFRTRNVHSLVIVRNGWLVAEAYDAGTQADVPQDVRSVTKSITSLLTGIALAERKLKSVDQTLAEFFPELAGDPLKAEIMIKHLLYMTSGLEWSNENDQASVDMMYSPNWIQNILERPSRHRPGTIFNYSNGDAHLLSAIVHKATGESLFDYAKSRLFAPLGIANVKWNDDPQGYTIGAWAMALTVRDMAKLGLLYLNEGRWDGATIAPKSWVRESLIKRVVHNYGDGTQGGYGYLWWTKPLVQGLPEGSGPASETFYAAGSGGPRIFVVPGLNLIAAFTATSPDVEMPEQLLNRIVQSIRSNKPLADNPEAAGKLNQAIQSFKTP